MSDGRQKDQKLILKKCVLETIDEFLKVSSISGMKYLQKGQLPGIKYEYF